MGLSAREELASKVSPFGDGKTGIDERPGVFRTTNILEQRLGLKRGAYLLHKDLLAMYLWFKVPQVVDSRGDTA